jgi:hypothetical protein
MGIWYELWGTTVQVPGLHCTYTPKLVHGPKNGWDMGSKTKIHIVKELNLRLQKRKFKAKGQSKTISDTYLYSVKPRSECEQRI